MVDVSDHMRTLHPTERKYLLDTARGLTAQQTARKHHVSINTVQASFKTSKKALGAINITHAVALCLVFGEFTHDDVRGMT